jgi:DNA-binding NtrC family response regulator
MKKFSSEASKYNLVGKFHESTTHRYDPLFLELSKTFLEVFHGITADSVNSARETLTKLEKVSYGVIVSDYDMTFIDSVIFLRTIRNKKISIPFILFTGF